MLANFDYFRKFETPTLSLCNPNNEVKGVLNGYTKNFKLSPVFNAVWEISIDIYKTKGRSKIKKELPCFDLIKTRRKILIENIGYFIITKVEINDGKYNNKYASVSATSCEISIANKKLNYFDGTYKFYDESEGNTTNPTTLMGKIMKFLPVWTLGHVDSSIANKYRTFDKPDDTVYGFLLSDVQKAYDCIFEFDMLNFVINVYDKLNYINKTTIFLTKEETIDDIKIIDDGTKIKTALNVFGQNDLDIIGVNPLGLNTIYNFDGCTDMMSSDLISAINAWEAKIEASQSTFESTLLSLKNENATLEVLNQELMTLQTNLAGYYEQQKPIIASGDNTQLAIIGGYITTTQSNIVAKQNQINAQQAIVDGLVTTRNNIFADNSFENNFTESQYNELSEFIIEDTYNDEYITKTDNMTYEQLQTQSLELYNKAKQVLSEISQPNYEYEISTNNFIFDKRFLPYTEQLKVGCLINIEVEEDNVIELILLKMDIDYEEKTINFTFGTKYKLEDPLSLFNDRYADLTTSANTVNYERQVWNKPVKSGDLARATAFIDSPINLNNNSIVDSNGNTLLNNFGYKGQTDDGKEIRLIDNMIFISNDNFITDSKKLVDGTGVLSSFVYSINSSLVGISGRAGEGTGYYHISPVLDCYIPNNFIVKLAILTMLVYPMYYDGINSFPSGDYLNPVSNSGWGYPHNMKTYLTHSPRKIAPISSSFYREMSADVTLSGDFSDVNNTCFSQSSITPYVNQGWNPNSNTTDFASVYTSSDISSLISSGFSTFAFQSDSPIYNENYEALHSCQYSGYLSCKLSILGYLKT